MSKLKATCLKLCNGDLNRLFVLIFRIDKSRKGLLGLVVVE